MRFGTAEMNRPDLDLNSAAPAVEHGTIVFIFDTVRSPGVMYNSTPSTLTGSSSVHFFHSLAWQ